MHLESFIIIKATMHIFLLIANNSDHLVSIKMFHQRTSMSSIEITAYNKPYRQGMMRAIHKSYALIRENIPMKMRFIYVTILHDISSWSHRKTSLRVKLWTYFVI